MLAKVFVRKSPARGFGEAVRYIARDNPDQAGAQRPELGTVNLDCPLESPEDRALAVSILDATAAAARQKTQGSVVYHVTLSWQAGEHPSPKLAEQACQTVMQALGYGEHQALWAVHRDTDNDHVHLLVNRVHKDGRTLKVPRKDWLLLDHAMRTIELAQGWNHSPGPYGVYQGQTLRLSRAERRAAGMLREGPTARAAAAAHREGGAPSFQEWVAGAPAMAIKSGMEMQGATWALVHQQAARYGLIIQPKGSGLIVTTTMEDGRVLAAKASQLGHWASKAALEQRLGAFVPAQGNLPAPGATYQKMLHGDRVAQQGPQGQAEDYSEERWDRRQERAAARKALAERFKTEQAQARTERSQQRAEMRERHQVERADLVEKVRQERAALSEQARQQGQPLAVVQSLWALRAAQEREAFQKRQAAERKALSARQPKQEVWRKWLEREAGQGDEAALAALRGIRYREQRQKNRQVDGIEGEELDPLRKLTLAGLDAQIDPKRQLVLYRGADGREKFTDTGPRIVIHDRSADSLEAALRMAAQKYGGKVEITGGSDFRERAARQAVRLGIAVADADLQTVVKDEQARWRVPPTRPIAQQDARAINAPTVPSPQQDVAAIQTELEVLHAALRKQWAGIERGGSLEWLHKARNSYRTKCGAWAELVERFTQAGGDQAVLPRLPHERRQRDRGMGR